jgi:hypothetical protein
MELIFSTGLLVYWFTGLLVYWFTGLLVYWFTGLLVYWFTGLLLSSMLFRYVQEAFLAGLAAQGQVLCSPPPHSFQKLLLSRMILFFLPCHLICTCNHTSCIPGADLLSISTKLLSTPRHWDGCYREIQRYGIVFPQLLQVPLSSFS